MRKLSFPAVAVAVCLSALLLTGCSGEKPTEPSPSLTATPTVEQEGDTTPMPTATSAPAPTAEYESNPIITTLFTADPSAHVWSDGKLYIYASHDIFPSRGCDLMDKYHVFSTTNLVDFTDEGEILSSADLSWGADGFMWAPDCACRDGKYYFYYPHPENNENWNSTWRVGVAVSDNPAGNFVDEGMMKNADGKTAVGEEDGTGNDYCSMIDPCVFADGDGSYYLFVGGGAHLYWAKISDDMVTLAEPLKEVPAAEVPDYHEGSWVFCREGKYYLMYADNTAGANCMRYSTADSVAGPWTPGGVFLTAVKDCDTTHGSIVEFKGSWYLFYHNAAISGNGTLRSVCIDKVEFDEDGAILPVVQTETGVAAVGERVLVDGNAAVRADLNSTAMYRQFTNQHEYLGRDFICGGGSSFNGTCIENMHLADAYCEIQGVDGGKGGKAMVTFVYSSADTAATALVTTSGDKSGDGYFLSLRGNGSWTNFTALSTILVDLNPGTDNTIRIQGGMYGFNLDKIIVSAQPVEE